MRKPVFFERLLVQKYPSLIREKANVTWIKINSILRLKHSVQCRIPLEKNLLFFDPCPIGFFANWKKHFWEKFAKKPRSKAMLEFFFDVFSYLKKILTKLFGAIFFLVGHPAKIYEFIKSICPRSYRNASR